MQVPALPSSGKTAQLGHRTDNAEVSDAQTFIVYVEHKQMTASVSHLVEVQSSALSEGLRVHLDQLYHAQEYSDHTFLSRQKHPTIKSHSQSVESIVDARSAVISRIISKYLECE